MSGESYGRPYKIVIWGSGTDYNRHVNILKYAEVNREIQIVAITANALPNVKTIDGWPVIHKNYLKNADFDYIVVMHENYFSDISTDIVNLGIERKRIIPCRVLDIPYFNWKDYIDILESDISIVCNNCHGGVLYHTLGLECRSPFKNLALSDKGLLRMLSDLKGYLSAPPQLIRWTVDVHSGLTYPVMAVKDVEIYFNHDKTIEGALEKWERRCKKVNFNNIFVSIYTEESDVVEQFLKLNDYPNKVCFVPYQGNNSRWKDIDNIYELSLLPEQTEFWEPVNSNVSNGKNSFTFDILSLLHMKKKYRIER